MIILIAAAVVTAFALVIDNIFNGLFLNWFADRFLDSSYYPYGIDTNALKILIFAVVVVICAIGVITAYFVAKKIDNKNKEEFSNTLREYIGKDGDEDINLPASYGVLAKDISEFKREMNKKEWIIKEETARKNDLITYLAHDLKTPMTSIIGYLTLLDEAGDMPEEQRKKYINVALEKSYRLDELFNEFFDITRYNLSNIKLNKKKTDISYMLVQIADEFYPILKDGQSIELEAENDIQADVDADKLARVFNNVIKNAVLYGYENSKINIKAEIIGDKNQEVKVTISNNGATIPEEKLQRIFEKFYRVDEARGANAGAGLGLAIAKEIVSLHGGSISAVSEDEMTVFTVTVPTK